MAEVVPHMCAVYPCGKPALTAIITRWTGTRPGVLYACGFEHLGIIIDRIERSKTHLELMGIEVRELWD